MLFQKVIFGNIVNKAIYGNIVNMMFKIIEHLVIYQYMYIYIQVFTFTIYLKSLNQDAIIIIIFCAKTETHFKEIILQFLSLCYKQFSM